MAFYVFARRRAQELCSNAAAARIIRELPLPQVATWEGPCVLEDLCGENHMPEACSMFEELSPRGRLAVIHRKQLCHFCFRHSDSQPCPSHSLPACPVCGCMRMHYRLLHDALQREEVRAIVIEVEPEPEDPEEEEEFYAANFEDIGQNYSDEDEGEESERETLSPVDSEEERPRLCQQRVPLEVDGAMVTLHTLYEWGSTVTLVRKEAAREVGLRPLRAPRRAVRGFEGKVVIVDSCYSLPRLDADGDVQVVCAYGVDEIATVARTRLPQRAGDIFPVIRASMPWMDTEEGPVDLLIGLDNTQWLPLHVEDSWDPKDDMRLIKSSFRHRYMIMGGWGRSLYPRDASMRRQYNAAGGQAGDQEEAQEVQLGEYHGWSRRVETRERPPPRDRTPPARGQRGPRGRHRSRGRRPAQNGQRGSVPISEDLSHSGDSRTLTQGVCRV